jgi:hypothetical protein
MAAGARRQGREARAEKMETGKSKEGEKGNGKREMGRGKERKGD